MNSPASSNPIAPLPGAVDPETLGRLEPVSSLSVGRIRELTEKTVAEAVAAGAALFTARERDRKLVYLLKGVIELRSAAGGSPLRATAGTPKTGWPLGG